MRSCTSGAAASSIRCSSCVSSAPTTSAAWRYGTRRWAKSSTGSRRMWSPFSDSAFLRSKRAGAGVTSATSNAVTISIRENTSRSCVSDQPSSAR